MYGFVEKELAQILVAEGLIASYEPYATSGGGTVAILDRRNFDLVFRTLVDYAGAEDVAVIDSDVAGMKIILHPYWMIEELFDALTPGHVKESEMYLRMRTEPSATRFDWNIFQTEFKSALQDRIRPREDDVSDYEEEEEERAEGENLFDDMFPNEEEQTAEFTNSANADTPLDDAPPAPTETEMAKWTKDYCYKLAYDCRNVEVDGKILTYHFNSILRNTQVRDICMATKRSVIVFRDHWSAKMPAILRELKTKFGKEYDKEILFIHAMPDHPRIYAGYMGGMAHSLFGYEVKDLHQWHSNSTQVRDNPNAVCGPEFAEFDYVYRDYKTGVIWALQKGCEVFFMMNLDHQPHDVQEVFIRELAARFDGALSYDEMVRRDAEYFQMASVHDRDAFVDMAVRNSNSLVSELKSQLLHAKESYKEAFDKAMEFAKVAQRLEDNLVRLDEKKMEEEEAERCTKMFEDVLTIPKVSAVKVTKDIVNIYTKNLYVQHDDSKKWYDVGTFHIQVGMYGSAYNSQTTVKVFNTKHQMQAFNEQMQAPHVFEDGHLCHGNLVGGMVDAYKRRDMYQMVLMILMFLQSANLDDSAGAYLPRWPEVSEEVATRPDEEEEKTSVLFEEQTEEESKYDEILNIPIHI